MSDKTKIIAYLKKHKTITCMEAVTKINVWNLRSRACEIPGIVSEMIEVKRKDGVKTRVARYSLATGSRNG